MSAPPNAKVIKQAVSIPVITVCSVRPDYADEMIGRGECDFAALGRQSLADPDWPNKAIGGHLEDMRQCLRCNECLGGGNKNRNLHCAVNPDLGHELDATTQLIKVDEPERVAIIGSGPAGLNAAISAAQRGQKVTLYEKDDRLGGLMYYVGKPDFKIDYKLYTDYLIHTVETLDVDVKLNCPFTMEEAEKQGYDKIIAATGSEWFKPGIPGADDEGILSPLDVLDDKYPDVDNFVICGAGLVGCEVAMHLAEKGKKVTMIDILRNCNPANLYGVDWNINSRLATDGVDVQMGVSIRHMSATEVVCDAANELLEHDMNTGKGTERPWDLGDGFNGGEIVFKGDAVICALGMRAVNDLAFQLAEAGYPVEIIGDAQAPRKLLDAVHEGFHAGQLC